MKKFVEVFLTLVLLSGFSFAAVAATYQSDGDGWREKPVPVEEKVWVDVPNFSSTSEADKYPASKRIEALQKVGEKIPVGGVKATQQIFPLKQVSVTKGYKALVAETKDGKTTVSVVNSHWEKGGGEVFSWVQLWILIFFILMLVFEYQFDKKYENVKEFLLATFATAAAFAAGSAFATAAAFAAGSAIDTAAAFDAGSAIAIAAAFAAVATFATAKYKKSMRFFWWVSVIAMSVGVYLLPWA